MNFSLKILIRALFSIAGFYLISGLNFAQTGSPLLSHYREGTGVESQNWSICQDDNRIMMFANRRGILTFDGHNWDLIRLPIIPYTLKYNQDIKTVFAGSENSFGYLERDEKGLYNYYSLSGDTIDCGLITNIFFTDTAAWFYSETCITKYDMVRGRIELMLEPDAESYFTGMFLLHGNVFVNVFPSGLHRIEGDSLVLLSSGYLLKEREILFSVPFDQKRFLLGLDIGKLILFDGNSFFDYSVKDEGYLEQNFLSNGIVVSDSLFAFSTLDGGVLIVEKLTGKIKYTINYARGLPDDEVYALGMDNNGGLWISHPYGLTRADLVLPAGNFSIYPGLKGNLTGSVVYNNELYVGTSEGVFYLVEEKQYEKIEVLVKQEPVVNVARSETVESVPQQKEVKEQKKEEEQVQQETPKTERRGILSRIFGRRVTREKEVKQEQKIEQPVEPAREEQVKLPEIKELPRPRYVKKTISRLKSIDYVFKKVEDFNEKCRQLVVSPAGILASTNKGLMIISNHSARTLVSNRYIYRINPAVNGKDFWISSSEGYFCISYSQGKWSITDPDPGFRRQVYSAVPVNDSVLWLGTDEAVARVILSNKPDYLFYKFKDDFPQRYLVDFVNDTLFVYSESDVRYYLPEKDTFEKYQVLREGTERGINYVLTQPGFPWINTGEEWICLNRNLNISYTDRSLLKFFDNIVSIQAGNEDIWVIDGENQIYRIQCNRIKTIQPDFHLVMKSVTNDHGDFFRLSDIEFGSNDNNIYFEFVSPNYYKKGSVRYQYIVENVMDEWSKWSSATTVNLMLQPGKYILKVRARDIWGNISEPEQVSFIIKPPFTRTAPFYVLVSLAGLLLIAGVIKFRERRLQREKRILEEKVRERTAEIEAQKEEITSSIEYAGKIQSAMLPSDELFRKLFADYFLIFKPRNIVSGDFYWIAEDESNIYFTVADCTGHGVPGAFMSTLGISMLNEIVPGSDNIKASDLLNILRQKIIESLHQTGKEGETPDGMDISFCILDKKRSKLQYAGAFNPIFLITNGEIKEYKADKMPIGYLTGKEISFTNQEIEVHPGDLIYLFSDGITDQFGGPEGKKYKKSAFKKLLSEIHHLSLAEQKEIIEKEYLNWKGNLEQVDDITILGLKI